MPKITGKYCVIKQQEDTYIYKPDIRAVTKVYGALMLNTELFKWHLDLFMAVSFCEMKMPLMKSRRWLSGGATPP